MKSFRYKSLEGKAALHYHYSTNEEAEGHIPRAGMGCLYNTPGIIFIKSDLRWKDILF